MTAAEKKASLSSSLSTAMDAGVLLSRSLSVSGRVRAGHSVKLTSSNPKHCLDRGQIMASLS